MSPGAFLATPLFSAFAKARLALEPFIARQPADEEETIAHFVRRRLGREFLDYAIEPFVAGIYAGDPERLSVPAAFPKLHALEQRYGSLIVGAILGARERRKRAETAKNTARSFSFREWHADPDRRAGPRHRARDAGREGRLALAPFRRHLYRRVRQGRRNHRAPRPLRGARGAGQRCRAPCLSPRAGRHPRAAGDRIPAGDGRRDRLSPRGHHALARRFRVPRAPRRGPGRPGHALLEFDVRRPRSRRDRCSSPTSWEDGAIPNSPRRTTRRARREGRSRAPRAPRRPRTRPLERRHALAARHPAVRAGPPRAHREGRAGRRRRCRASGSAPTTGAAFRSGTASRAPTPRPNRWARGCALP